VSFAIDLHSSLHILTYSVFVGSFGAQTRCRSLDGAVTPCERERVAGERVVCMARRHCHPADLYAFKCSFRGALPPYSFGLMHYSRSYVGT